MPPNQKPTWVKNPLPLKTNAPPRQEPSPKLNIDLGTTLGKLNVPIPFTK